MWNAIAIVLADMTHLSFTVLLSPGIAGIAGVVLSCAAVPAR